MQLLTSRLILRPFEIGNGDDLVRLLQDHRIADNTCYIPFPYTKKDAENFINEFCRQKNQHVFAMVLKENSELIGAISLVEDTRNCACVCSCGCQSSNKTKDKEAVGTLGYWLGVSCWHKGYASEAARAVIKYGFETLRLQQIKAEVFSYNTFSERVLTKVGMSFTNTNNSFIKMRSREEQIKNFTITLEQYKN